MITRILENAAQKFSDHIIDAYWGFATSGLVLAALLIIAIGLSLVAMISLIPIQYRAFAKPLSIVSFFFFALNFGHRLADQRAELAQARLDLAFTQLQLANQKQTAADADRIARAAVDKASTLDQKVFDYETRFAKLPPSCDRRLTDADDRELQDIGRGVAEPNRLSLIQRLRGFGKAR